MTVSGSWRGILQIFERCRLGMVRTVLSDLTLNQGTYQDFGVLVGPRMVTTK